LPKQAGRPVYFPIGFLWWHFWSLMRITCGLVPHHLHYTSFAGLGHRPLGMSFPFVLLHPSWGGMINGMIDGWSGGLA